MPAVREQIYSFLEVGIASIACGVGDDVIEHVAVTIHKESAIAVVNGDGGGPPLPSVFVRIRHTIIGQFLSAEPRASHLMWCEKHNVLAPLHRAIVRHVGSGVLVNLS